jgi:hypothetical protein
MSRAFSVHTILRQSPNRLLQEFFERLGCGGLGLAWETLGEHDVRPMVAALHALPLQTYDSVEAQLHGIFNLACNTGTHALHEALAACGHAAPAEALPQDVNAYGRALWAWLNARDVFDLATRIFQVEHFTWWGKRKDLPACEPDLTAEALGRLRSAVSRIFLEEQGRGRRCTIEPFRRRDTVYLFTHPDDYAQYEAVHDERDVLTPSTFRRTFLVVYAYNCREGSLEWFAQGPGPLKGRLEEAFADAILGRELDTWNAQPGYALGHLLAPGFELATNPADGVRARIRKMRLHLKHSKRRITLEADPDATPGDVYRMMEELLDRRKVPPSSVFVGMVTFCFEFDGADGGRGGSMTFDVAYPSSCGLRNQRPEYVEVALKYLKRWGIDGSGGVGIAPATAGP